MPTYSLRYIDGPNDHLKIGPEELIQAASFEEALATRTHWPVEITYDRSSACARNPGTSLYYFEAWEAHPVTSTPETTPNTN